MHILVTGGAGYIGSHTCVELLEAGYQVTVVDNLSNSKQAALRRVSEITGREPGFVCADLRDRMALDALFRDRSFDAVVSSATVYGDPASVPIREDFPTCAINPYGRSKLFIEEILRDLYRSDGTWSIALLRYFNPVGAHRSGRIGEDPNGVPNNLMPFIAQVAVGKQPRLQVFGDDYDTPDGTGIRDYIHVTDLARGHLKALQRLSAHPGIVTCNLGTGRGYRVLEIVHAFERACGRSIPFDIVGRRPGDIAGCYADPGLARTELDWTTDSGVEEMVRDTWRWQSQNPDGYG